MGSIRGETMHMLKRALEHDWGDTIISSFLIFSLPRHENAKVEGSSHIRYNSVPPPTISNARCGTHFQINVLSYQALLKGHLRPSSTIYEWEAVPGLWGLHLLKSAMLNSLC
jgi:hypothetical protein